MKKSQDKPADAAELRRRAEERLSERKKREARPGTKEEPQRLLHELQVHQIELEMQNETLRQTQASLEEAIKKYKMAVSLAPEKSWTHNILGNAYLQKGQYSEAITEFKNALSINPKSEYAKEKMEDANEKMAKKK